MGSSQSQLQEHEVQDLSEKTGFSPEQIRTLHKRFKNLTKNRDTLSRNDLENIPDLTFNPIRSQIINAFFDKRNFSREEVGAVEEIVFEEFLTVMSHFRPLKQNLTQEDKERIRKEKLRFLFNMHDKDSDGMITLDEYRKLVEELLSTTPTIEAETSKAIADAAMLEVASVTMGQMERTVHVGGVASVAPHLNDEYAGIIRLVCSYISHGSIKPMIQAPDEVYEGIRFEHFLQILNGVEIASRMYIRFLYVDTTTMGCSN